VKGTIIFFIFALLPSLALGSSIFEEKAGLLKHLKKNHYSFYRVVRGELIQKREEISRGLASKDKDLKKDLAQFYIKSFINENPEGGLKELEKNSEFLKIYFSQIKKDPEKTLLISSLKFLWEKDKGANPKEVPLRAFQIFEILN